MSDTPALPQSRDQLIDRTERSWREWVAAVEGIPDDRLAEPAVGHWSVKDLIGHVAFWEDWVIGHGQRIIAGEPAPEEPDDVNQTQVAENKGATVAAQKRYRDEAHARLAAFLATVPEDQPTFGRLVEALEWETFAHYDEHTAQVREWREAHGL